MSQNSVNKISELITEPVSSLGYNIVRIKFLQQDRFTLQIMIENSDLQTPITVDDCEKVSHYISAILDVEDPIEQEYSLEVSSPGINRPLVKIEDFIRFVNNEVKITTNTVIQGKKRFTGKLTAVEGETILITSLEQEEKAIEFSLIEEATLKNKF